MSPERNEPGADLRRATLKTLFWILAGALLFNSIFGDMGLIQGIRQRRAAVQLRQQVHDLRQQNTVLVADVKGLQKEGFRIETIAREDLGLCRPGEILFLFQDNRLAPPATPAPPR
jgi:cell division protein FtsB